MSNKHKIFIVILGITLSFLLFEIGLDYNAETNPLGQEIRECEENKDYRFCQYRSDAQQEEIFRRYGKTSWQLENDFWRQRYLFIVPVVILIVTVFVSFTLDAREYLFITIILLPLAVSFLFRLFLAEFCLTPIYIFCAALAAVFFSHVKRLLWSVNP